MSELLSEHQQNTEQQIGRLRDVSQSLDLEPQDRESPTMEGILAEHDDISNIEDALGHDELDPGIVMGIERLEITSLEISQRLGFGDGFSEDVIEPLATPQGGGRPRSDAFAAQ